MTKARLEEIQKMHALSQIDMYAPIPEDQTVFRISFASVGSLGDYVLVTGTPKAGKGKYISGAMASAISKMEVFGMKIKLPDNKKGVAHFDTEQSTKSHIQALHLMRRLAGDQNIIAPFHSFHLRQYAPRNVMALMEYHLEKYPETGLIVLDGLLDMIDSFNDEKASKSLIDWLKRITEANNILVIAVLHRSVSNDKSIGHLGSSADRAAQSVLKVEKNKETKQYLLMAEYLREADDFPTLAIRYNTQLDIWEACDYMEEPDRMNPAKVKSLLKRKPSDYDLMEHTSNVVRIFNYTTTHSHASLIQRIVEVYGTGKDWAKECVKVLEKNNLIFRTDEGFTNISQGRMFNVK